MQAVYLNFDRVTAYLLESIADMRQITFADLLRRALQDYLQARPKPADMIPTVRLSEAQKRTYSRTAKGPNVKFPCRKTGYFESNEFLLLEYAADGRKVTAVMRQIAVWWLSLPDNEATVAQLMERFEQQPAH